MNPLELPYLILIVTYMHGDIRNGLSLTAHLTDGRLPFNIAVYYRPHALKCHPYLLFILGFYYGSLLFLSVVSHPLQAPF